MAQCIIASIHLQEDTSKTLQNPGLRKMTHESRGSTQEHALRVHESAGKLEVPLQGLRSPVDLRLALHEAIDDHGKRKYYLEAQASSDPSLESSW
eukprot:g18858.t1